MPRRASLLPWIVAFKAAKAALLTMFGVTVLFLIHRDPVDVVLQVAQAVHLPLTSRPIDRVLTLALRSTPTKEVAVALSAFAFAILLAVEGVGLYRQRSWARWFTIGTTSALMPIELFEIVREPRPLRILILVLNVAVVGYLWRRRDVFE
jgi:uncharacterized membrane protein (DUF2068 family)